MLSVQENPLKQVNLSDYFLARVAPSEGNSEQEDELSMKRKSKELAHLRKIQSTNFVGRAVIRLADLFRKAA